MRQSYFFLHSQSPQGQKSQHAYRSLGNKYFKLSNVSRALDYYQLDLGIAKEAGVRDRERRTYSLLGIAHQSLGDFQKATDFHQQALRISKEIRDKNSEGLANNDLGNVCHCLGDFKKAIEYHQQALSIARNIGDKALEGKAYCDLGNNFHFLGDFKTAIEFHQHVLGNAKDVGDKALEGMAYNNIGHACRFLGDLEKAINVHQEALNIAKDTGDRPLEGKTFANLGIAFRSLGEFKRAIEFFQMALSISKEVRDKVSEGMAYNNLGNAHSSLGDFKTAVEFYQQALGVSKGIGNKASEGKTYANLGVAYSSLGEFKTAIEFYQQALRIAKDVGDSPSERMVNNNLAIAYRSLGDYEKAIEFFQQTLSSAKAVADKALEGMVYTNLGNAYNYLGNVKTAIEFYQQAVSIAVEVGNKASEGKACNNLGIAYRSLGDFESAIKFQQQALRNAKDVGDKASQGKACNNLGTTYHSIGELCKAEEFFESSVRLFNEVRDLLRLKDQWKISLRNQFKMAYDALWGVQLEQNKTADALCTAERGRAQALMDLMESQYGIKSAKLASYEQMRTISDIASHITSPTVFLAVAEKSVIFWVLQKGQKCQFILKTINDTLQSLTEQTYKNIGVFKSVMCENRSLDESEDEESNESFDRGPDMEKSASSDCSDGAFNMLSDVLISPITSLIQGDEVTIVPDGTSFLIPFAALVDQHSRYLSETFRIRLVPSLTSLKLMAECPEGYHSTSGALLVGDPWVENVRFRRKRVKQLPAARKEVEMIGKILRIDPLTGKDATKGEVLSRLNSVALVHIAAHGCTETGEIILSPNPTRSKKPKEEDFLLTMADVLNAKLRARLVVLSCCHSGRGKIKAEGVVGIARAFLGAGARSVLASLWAIDDEATLEFMRIFYEHLMEGQRASKSLNQAMKAMRESDNFSDMKYWAPFVLIGDDVALTFEQTR